MSGCSPPPRACRAFSWRHAAALLVALRTLALFWRCREEHHGSPCEESALLRIPSEPGVYGLERVALACLCTLGVAFKALPPRGESLTEVLSRACLLGATCALAAHWLVQLKPAAEVNRILGTHQVGVAGRLAGCREHKKSYGDISKVWTLPLPQKHP